MQLTQAGLPNSKGFVLIEALFALALVGLGLFAFVRLLQPSLQVQRQQIARESAMRLADNLMQRMHLNSSQATAYSQDWGTALPNITTDCAAQACTAPQLAQWDVQQWRLLLQTQLPAGDANVFISPDAWWGIVMAWQDEGETFRTDLAHGTPPCPAHKSCWRIWFRP